MSNLISKIQFTKNQKKILKSALEPPSTEWLWLKTQNGVSTLYDYVNGKWTAVGGSCRDINHSSECGDDVLNKGDYVTWNSLSGALDKTMNTVSTWLEGYLKEADFSNYITKDEVSNYISESFRDVLNGYQPLLTPGQSISLSTNKGGGSTISVKMGGIGAGKSDPVSGNSVYTELQKINEALSGKQAKLVSGTNIKKIQTETYTDKNQKSTSIQDLLGSGNVSVQAPITDLYAIRSGAAAGSTAVQSGDIKNLLSGNLKTINNQTIVGSGNITIEGGGGDGTSVTVLNPDESPSSNTGVYFFVDSPLQVEGDYNNLLQTGSDNGYTFSPGNLYSLGYSKRTVDGVEKGFLGFNMLGDHTNLDVRDNVVYINGQMTTMKYYGDVVVSDRIKMADTSDTAIIRFMVVCPFAADSTTITLHYNSSDIEVQYLYSDKNWRAVPALGFSFSNIGNGKSITLRVIRKNKDYNICKSFTLTLNNGYEDTAVEVVYNKTVVFFKGNDAGNECQNGFNVADINTYTQSSKDGNGDFVLSPDKPSRFAKIDTSNTDSTCIKYEWVDRSICLLKDNVPIDLSKYNVIYIVTDTISGHSWMEVGAFLKDWRGIASGSEDRYRLYAKTYFNQSSYEIYRDLEQRVVQKQGYTVLKCPITKMRILPTNSVKDVSVNLYVIGFNIAFRVKEFGVITYDY